MQIGRISRVRPSVRHAAEKTEDEGDGETLFFPQDPASHHTVTMVLGTLSRGPLGNGTESSGTVLAPPVRAVSLGK